MNRPDFDTWALGLAAHAATRSRDPSTKVGAAIVRPDNTVASLGYNGFPRGVMDFPGRYDDRPTKYAMTCHAEANAIVSAREPLHYCTLYVTHAPCAECAKLAIQAGIGRVIYPAPSAEMRKRWGLSFAYASVMFDEAGVAVREV